MRGRVWKFGDSIDTDVISPNQRAPTYEDLKKITMDAFRPEFAQEVKPGDILVGGKNFGCGSHRETANAVLRDVGIQAIVAESMARIFFRIGISFGMPTFVAPGIVGLVDDGEEIEINYSEGFIKNSRTGKQIPLEKYPPSIERIFMAGGIAPLIVERYEKEGG
jgi:3-isopropylmalate dehydratase small subunit